jgi:hypothetical protein
VAQCLDGALQIAIAVSPICPGAARHSQGVLRLFVYVLAVGQLACKGLLAPNADRLNTAADILILANSTAPQSRVGRLMHDRGGNHFRRRCFCQNEPLVELTGAK